jgi:hypothetical protein
LALLEVAGGWPRAPAGAGRRGAPAIIVPELWTRTRRVASTETVDSVGMSVEPPEAGRCGGGDAERRGEARRGRAAQRGVASRGDVVARSGGMERRAGRSATGGSAWARALVARWAPKHLRRLGGCAVEMPVFTTATHVQSGNGGAGWGPRDGPKRLQPRAAASGEALEVRSCHHPVAAMATHSRASGSPNNPVQPTVRAGSRGSPARPAADRVAVRRGGLWRRVCDIVARAGLEVLTS